MKLGKTDDIWELKPTREDLRKGADYAAITLPWTFNRMGLNWSSRGQRERALNIAKGIVAQEMLKRKFNEIGIRPDVDRTSYRSSDLFDFKLPINGQDVLMDIKTINYYRNYSGTDREPLSKDLIINNRAYFGPDWRQFFPMLIPATQINQEKEIYCFGIASSDDFRSHIDEGRTEHRLHAFPFLEHLPFLCTQKLIKMREEAGRGFFLQLSLKQDSDLFASNKLSIELYGEWDGEKQIIPVELDPDGTPISIGPFSSLCSVRITRESFSELNGEIHFTIKNKFKEVVLNTARRNINSVPQAPMILTKNDFANLILPSDYTLYFLGWVSKDEYLSTVPQYSGYVWPNDKENKYHNQVWDQITENDLEKITRYAFESYLQKTTPKLNAGWLKTHGRGGGACCYVFPNIGRNGGVKETNLYVLPQDLNRMAELG